MRKFLAVLVAALSVVAVAGAANASAPAKKKPPVTLDGDVTNKGVGAVKGGKVKIEADDFYFKKTFVKGKAGSTAHTFTIDSQAIDETVQPGDSIEVDVKIPKNGKAANFYCRFHVSSGMQGAFFSKAGGTAKAKQQDDGGSGSGDGGYGY